MQIIETFEIAGRGLVVVPRLPAGLPMQPRLIAVVTCPDGRVLRAEAWLEWMLERGDQPAERPVFLLKGLSKPDIPIASSLAFEPEG
ncbi:MAG: hypothetical protein QM608_18595 [Caulobacter sp.]